jgi:hypothetical protein
MRAIGFASVVAVLLGVFPGSSEAQWYPPGVRGVDIDENESAYFILCQHAYDDALRACQAVEECLPGLNNCFGSLKSSPTRCLEIFLACVSHLDPDFASDDCKRQAQEADQRCYDEAMGGASPGQDSR